MKKQSHVFDPKHPIDYSKQDVPPHYKCSGCAATNCKLWRDFQTFLSQQTLLCLNCACREQKKVLTPTEDGHALYTGEVYHFYRSANMAPNRPYAYNPKYGTPPDAIEKRTERAKTNQIGWRVPAIPTEENDTYWGYTSVPQAGCDWWYRLPTLPIWLLD